MSIICPRPINVPTANPLSNSAKPFQSAELFALNNFVLSAVLDRPITAHTSPTSESSQVQPTDGTPHPPAIFTFAPSHFRRIPSRPTRNDRFAYCILARVARQRARCSQRRIYCNIKRSVYGTFYRVIQYDASVPCSSESTVHCAFPVVSSRAPPLALYTLVEQWTKCPIIEPSIFRQTISNFQSYQYSLRLTSASYGLLNPRLTQKSNT